MHASEHADDMILIPVTSFTLFHLLTVGGGNTQGNVVCQQRLQSRRLQACKYGRKRVKILKTSALFYEKEEMH